MIHTVYTTRIIISHSEVKKFLIELRVVLNIIDPINLYYDNNNVIVKLKGHNLTKQSKLILKQFHIISEIVQCRNV